MLLYQLFSNAFMTFGCVRQCSIPSMQYENNLSHLSHLGGSSTSVGRPGHSLSPVLAVENVDVSQPILLDVSSDGVHVSKCRSSSLSHTFYHHVHHCSGGMAFVSTSDMSIPA